MRTRIMLLTAALVAAICLGTVQRPVEAGIIPIDRNQEIELGREVTARFEPRVHLITSGPQYDRVQRIGHKIAETTGVTELPWTFKIVDDPTINAITFPGGFIYVFRGLLDQGIDDNALAGVLGHECTHAVKSHAMKTLIPITMVGRHLPRSVRENAAAKLLTALTTTGVGRHLELEADALGAGYAYHAGYDPEGLIAVFEIFERLQRTNPSLMQRMLETHPEPAVRIAKLRPVIARLKSGH